MTTSPRAALAPVLVIEDEPSVLRMLTSALERNGYTVVTATNGIEGLRLLGAAEYYGVISDMRMPGGVTGADVHAWLVENRPELAARMLFVTGDIVSEETARLLARTGAPCIEKPFRVHQLIEAIEKVFGEKQ